MYLFPLSHNFFYKTTGVNFTSRRNTLCVIMKHLIKKASSALLNFTKLKARFGKLKLSRKCMRVFIVCRGLRYMTVSEMLETMQGNNIFEMFAEFSNVAHILAVIPTISCSQERSCSCTD